MKKLAYSNKLILLFFLSVLLLSGSAFPGILTANDDLNTLKQQLEQLTNTLKGVEQKIADLEKQDARKKSDIKEMEGRLDKAELHTATDKISFGVELRSRADSIHFSDMLTAPDALFGAFFTPASSGGFNGATGQQIQQAMMNMQMAGMVPPPEKNDVHNDIIFTNRFRLDMKAKINRHLEFAGRLAAYKVAGDSTGVKFNQGSLGDISFDGTTSSLPHGDTIHLERAYFNYKYQAGQCPDQFLFRSPPLHRRRTHGIWQLRPGGRIAPDPHHQLAVRRRLPDLWSGGSYQHSGLCFKALLWGWI